jgi:hypothetical protein
MQTRLEANAGQLMPEFCRHYCYKRCAPVLIELLRAEWPAVEIAIPVEEAIFGDRLTLRLRIGQGHGMARKHQYRVSLRARDIQDPGLRFIAGIIVDVVHRLVSRTPRTRLAGDRLLLDTVMVRDTLDASFVSPVCSLLQVFGSKASFVQIDNVERWVDPKHPGLAAWLTFLRALIPKNVTIRVWPLKGLAKTAANTMINVVAVPVLLAV